MAIGHRDSIQQEMLKERLSDLLGELCLFASAVTKFQKSCEHTVSVQLRASDVNVGFENFLQHFCLSHLGQSKCERKQQLSTSFLPSSSVASMEHQVLCECCQCSVPNSSDELILVKRRALFGQKYGRWLDGRTHGQNTGFVMLWSFCD